MRTWLLLAGVVALAVAALADGIVGGGSAAGEAAVPVQRLQGADVPPEGALGGRLLYAAAPGCELRSLQLTDLTLAAPGPGTSCLLYPSPSGVHALVGRPGPETADTVLELVRLDAKARLLVHTGPTRGDVSWSAGGERVAWCAPDGSTRVLAVAGGGVQRFPGCSPRFTPSGDLLTIADEPGRHAVLLDGIPLLGEDALARGFDRAPAGSVHALGTDERADGLVAVVASASPAGEQRRTQVRLQLWRDGHLLSALSLRGRAYPFEHRRFGELLRFSPDGSELAVGFDGTGVPLLLLDVRTLETTLGPVVQHGFAWSPDGAYFALSTGSDVRISGALRSEPVYVLPLRTASLSWPQGEAG